MQISRREMLQGAVAAAGALTLHGNAAFAQKAKPNIIFILADDLGYGDLGCYGQQQILTPNLDRMAAEGTRFTQCYAGSTVCAPSRCCLMTGLHSGHAYVRGNARLPLRPEDATVAEMLENQGYKTALIGKWGLGNEGTTGEPKNQGFDYSFGYLDQHHAHNYYPEKLIRNGAYVSIDGNKENPPGIAVERNQYSHDLFMQEAYDFVSANKANPFFLYLALTIPHANNERGNAEGDGMEVPDAGPYADKDWPQVQKHKAAMITRMDTDIGKLFDKLKSLGIDENTIVFFSSDNGPHKEGGVDPTFFSSGGGLRGTKRDLYEGGVRVPGIARWPGHVPAGTTSNQIWAFWDILPTLGELTGAPIQKGLDGISVLPALLGKPQSQQHEYLYWEFHERGSKQAVRAGDWKGVRFYGGAFELYNLKEDLAETKDVSLEHPDVVKQLQGYMDSARTETPDWKLRVAPAK
jgi:arylsulfatase A-like enzyme